MHEAPMSTIINIPSLFYQKNMHQLFLPKLPVYGHITSICYRTKQVHHLHEQRNEPYP